MKVGELNNSRNRVASTTSKAQGYLQFTSPEVGGNIIAAALHCVLSCMAEKSSQSSFRALLYALLAVRNMKSGCTPVYILVHLCFIPLWPRF